LHKPPRIGDFCTLPFNWDVEIYPYVNSKGDDTLLELEVHGTYKTIKPVETMFLTETWELYPHGSEPRTIDQIKLLEPHRSK